MYIHFKVKQLDGVRWLQIISFRCADGYFAWNYIYL